MANSGFPGVYYAGPGKYRSRYRSDGKTIHLGTFDTAEKAHEMYKLAKAREPFKVGDAVIYSGVRYKIEFIYKDNEVFRIGNSKSFVDMVNKDQLSHP